MVISRWILGASWISTFVDPQYCQHPTFPGVPNLKQVLLSSGALVDIVRNFCLPTTEPMVASEVYQIGRSRTEYRVTGCSRIAYWIVRLNPRPSLMSFVIDCHYWRKVSNVSMRVYPRRFIRLSNVWLGFVSIVFQRNMESNSLTRSLALAILQRCCAYPWPEMTGVEVQTKSSCEIGTALFSLR